MLVTSTITSLPLFFLQRVIRLLARRGHFINIPESDIRDKSKADLLAKGLVILQVTWMFLQSISRKAAGLPLSPLETHNLVHAGCALFMYILWFRNPLDVRAPTLVSTAGFENLLALMLMQSRPVGRTTYSHLDRPKYYEWILYGGSRSEAFYLMFDDTPQLDPLDVLDDAQCASKKKSQLQESLTIRTKRLSRIRRDIARFALSPQIRKTNTLKKLSHVNPLQEPQDVQLASIVDLRRP